MLIEDNTWKIFAPYNILVSLRGLMDEVCSQIVEYRNSVFEFSTNFDELVSWGWGRARVLGGRHRPARLR